jgi:hypothetical protein
MFRRLTLTKKLRNVKIKVKRLSPEFGNVRSPLPDFGEQVWLDLAKIAEFINGWIRLDRAESRPFWPNQ